MRLSIAVVCALVASATVLLAPARRATAADPSPVCTETAASETAARQMAAACAKRVEALSLRSERSQVFAESGGSFTYEATLTPQRVRKADGSWTGIDRTLQRRADGAVVPAASVVDVQFSGGGSGPFVQWRRNGHLFTMSWPTALPAPVLAGSSATYPSVMDGVDLVVTATDEGFRHVLVVRTAKAAADPRIRDIRYGLGGDVRMCVLLSASSEAANPVNGGESTTARWMRFNVANFKLVVVYNSLPVLGATSTSPATTCVSGDTPAANRPGVSRTPTLSAVALDDDPGETDLKTIFEWQPWVVASSTWGAVSSLSQNNVARDTAGQVTPSTLPDGTYRWRVRVADPWSVGGTSGEDTTAWSAWCQFQVDTVNPGLPTVTSTDFPSGCAPCGNVGTPGQLTFSGVSDVVAYLWGPLDPPTNTATATAPGAPVTVSFTPDRGGPTAIHVRAIDWAGNQSPIQTYTFDVTPPADNVGRWLQTDWEQMANLDDTADASVTHNLTLAAGSRDGTGRTIGEAALTLTNTGAEGQYATTSAVLDPTMSFTLSAFARLSISPTSSDFRTIVSQRGSATSVIELQAQPSGWCLNARDIGSGGSSNALCGGTVKIDVWTHVAATYDNVTSRFRVYVDGEKVADVAHVAPSSQTGPLAVGASWLNDVIRDRWTGRIADVRVWQRSLTSTEVADLAAPPLVGKWSFGETRPPEIDDSGRGNDLNFSGPGITVPAGGQAINGTAMQLNGTANAYSDYPVLRTNNSFTVSAWVRPDNLTGTRVIASQDGVNQPGFSLEYSQAANRWVMRTVSADSAGAVTTYSATSAWPAVLGNWTNVVGTYDAGAKQLRIFVDGVPGTVANTVTNWHANGSFRLGAVGSGGSFIGSIDEVNVYNGCAPTCKIRADALTDFANVQGANNWTYQETDGTTYWPMTFDASRLSWQGSTQFSLVGDVYQHPGPVLNSVRTWTAPRAGMINVSWNAITVGAGGNGTKVKVLKNTKAIWGEYLIAANSSWVGTDVVLNQTIVAGDVIRFVVNANGDNGYDSTNWVPVINYVPYDHDLQANFSSTQGDSQWYYQEYTGGAYVNMTYNNAGGYWNGSAEFLQIRPDGVHPVDGKDAVIVWRATKPGVVAVTTQRGRIGVGNGGGADGTRIKIVKSRVENPNVTTPVWPASGTPQTIPAGQTIDFTPLIVSVGVGDLLYFQVNANANQGFDSTFWVPQIDYVE